MKSSLVVLTVLTLSLIAGVLTTVQASVVADGAQLQKLAAGYSFTEGPAVDAAGNVFFTDQPKDRIMKLSTDGTLSTFLSPCGRANGLFFDRQGNLWACADYHNELWKIDPNGTVIVVISNYLGKLLNGPNDLWIRRLGGIYFTDPYFSRNYWDHRSGMEQSGQHVYYLAPDMMTLIQVTDDLQQPNGIIGTPDGRYLYVADYGGNKTYRYTIQPDGTLSNKSLFCSQGSDGMTIDEEGNIYLTKSGVAVFDRLGNKIETISVPESTTNVTFGGPDARTLYITAGGSLYSLQMNVQGASLSPDFNSDERVDFLDYTNMVKSWKQDEPNVDLGPTTLGDGIIDIQDIALLADNWLEEILPVGLRAYWKLDEESGPIAKEYIDSRNAILFGDRLWMPDGGKVGGALQFDGLDDYVNIPYIVGPAEGSFSVFTWIKDGAPGEVIISQKEYVNWLSVDIDGKLIANLAPTTGRPSTPTLVTDVVVTDGNWHHIGLVWDGDERIVYIDGIEAARDMEPRVLLTSHNGLYLGTDDEKTPGKFWSGLIDDLRIYDCAVVPK
ncbi:MAG: SMP-30/gluconolactonase/LRE family protein [Sedimentisphaerales bacterium]|nr:SMP-30/gluconolactonase/LRE family protein [Sedimentisphaerales bacterium]